MPEILNLARVATAAQGTDDIVLGAAIPGFLSFEDAGAVDGGEYYYGIRDGASSEAGTGTYLDGELSRDTVLSSTNGNEKINLSGSGQVFSAMPAEGVIESGLLTTRGDMIRRGPSAPERVALGASTTLLGSDGTDAVWKTIAQVKADLGLPTSSADNGLPRFNGTNGALQTSGASITDGDIAVFPGGMRSGSVVVADDAVANLGNIAPNLCMLEIWNASQASPTAANILNIRTSSSPICRNSMGGATEVTVGTTDVSGTTGDDGKHNFRSISGAFKIENRANVLVTYGYRIASTA